MTFFVEEAYSSSNGDRWWMVRDPTAGRIFVRHEPNPASGGNVTEVEIEDFLKLDRGGPEHAAVRLLMEKRLAELDREAEGRSDRRSEPNQ